MSIDIELTAAERLGLQEKQSAFNAVLLGEDPLGVIIRAHIYIEHEIIAFIESQVAAPEALRPLGLDYDGRVNLAIALGLPADIKPALSCVGKLRNRFAHRLETALGKQEVDGLKNAMGEDFQVAMQSLHRTSEKMENPFPEWAKMAPNDQMSMLLITLWSKLAVINHGIRAHNETPTS